jgi:hypothetical protein
MGNPLHDALKPERLGLLCGSESEAHGAQVSALRAARLRRPRRLSRALGTRSFSDRRTARGAEVIPPQRSNRAFPMPQHDSPKDRVLGLCNLPPEIFVTKALNQVARAPTPSVKRQAAHTAPHTRLQYVCGTRTSLRVNKGLDSCTRNVQLDDTTSSCRAARRRPPG